MACFTEMISAQPLEARGACIALLGGGGKTSMLRRLGQEYSEVFPRVLLTSLTLSARDHGSRVLFLSDLGDAGLAPHFVEHNPVCVMNRAINEHKLEGVPEAVVAQLADQADLCVFECDGARNLPLKVHNDRDPVVPDFATHVIILVGADAVDQSLSGGRIHRPERFAEWWGVDPETPLDAAFIAQVVTTRKGYLSKVPERMQPVYFVNKADDYPEQAQRLADAIVRRGIGPVFMGSVVKGVCRRVSR
ncbi:MAG: selenium cofactor biosynthesis protein YqeC [bacterium]